MFANGKTSASTGKDCSLSALGMGSLMRSLHVRAPPRRSHTTYFRCSPSRCFVQRSVVDAKATPLMYGRDEVWRGTGGRHTKHHPGAASLLSSISPSFMNDALFCARSRKSVCVSAGQWLESSAQIDVPVPLEHAWSLWEDRPRIPNWMPWIKSVEVMEDDTSLSKWTLSTYQFNRQWEFSWVAQNLTPLKNQKIHWRSVPGSVGGSFGSIAEIQNSGQIRFARKGASECSVKMTISYEVPDVLVPFVNLLNPVVHEILQRDMERFQKYAVDTVDNP